MVLAIYGTPRWAGPARNRVPRRATDLRSFANAAARRYSGTYTVKEQENEPERTLPAVRSWLAWNEPNNPVFLRPQWKMVARKWRVQAAYDYAKICSAIYAGVKSTRLAGSEGRLRRHGPAGKRRTAQLAAVDLAARLHVLAPPSGREADGRLRAPSLLRSPD